jgi:hypothetical protein
LDVAGLKFFDQIVGSGCFVAGIFEAVVIVVELDV